MVNNQLHKSNVKVGYLTVRNNISVGPLDDKFALLGQALY